MADLGCGIGTLLPTLASRFRRVLAVDFSPAMLARARRACPQRNVSLQRADLADLRRLRGRLDVAVTVNAVLTPEPERLDRIFAGIAASLRPGGLLIGVFPAMEPVLYQGFLIHERERRVRDPQRARVSTSRILERAKYDFVHRHLHRERAGAEVLLRLRAPPSPAACRLPCRPRRPGELSVGRCRGRLRELPGRGADVGLAVRAEVPEASPRPRVAPAPRRTTSA